jgi:hypothetical protein
MPRSRARPSALSLPPLQLTSTGFRGMVSSATPDLKQSGAREMPARR